MAKSRDFQALKTILSYRRPADTRMVRRFANRFLRPLGAEPDTRGNWWLQIGKAPIVLWSAHIDTVHSSAGRQQVKQLGPVLYTPDGDCLGADDGAGTWMLREMAKAGVPGLYIWHTAEERGCQGSSWIAQYREADLKGIKFALAFDRRGTKDIITSQMGGRCCSMAFVSALSSQLGMGHTSAPGSYTDTAEYAEIIPECSNISVGFQNEHSSVETLDVNYLFRLRDRVISRIDPSKWPVERTPGSLMRWSSGYGGYGHYGTGAFSEEDYAPHWWTCIDKSCTARLEKDCDVYLAEPDRKDAASNEEKWSSLERNYYAKLKEEPTSEDCLAAFDEEAFLRGELGEDEMAYRQWLRDEIKSQEADANWGWSFEEGEVSNA